MTSSRVGYNWPSFIYMVVPFLRLYGSVAVRSARFPYSSSFQNNKAFWFLARGRSFPLVTRILIN
jgi:hypothetical protein